MKNKSALITAAGVIIFLAAGMLTMLFFPSQPQKNENQKPLNISQPVQKIDVEIPEIKNEKNEIQIEKPKSDWYVYVTGEVKNPGYYKISADTRIFHAIEAAGGFTAKADITSVNMASPLVDGLQINVESKRKTQNFNNVVKIPGLAQKPAPVVINVQENKKTQDIKNNSGLVDINNASEKELEQLKGVGPSIAKRIVEYRQKNGKFSTPDDLIKVKGIGSVKLEKMRSQILIR